MKQDEYAEALQAVKLLLKALRFFEGAEVAITAGASAEVAAADARAELVELRAAKERLETSVTLLRNNRAVLDQEYQDTVQQYTDAHAENMARIAAATEEAEAEATRKVAVQESARRSTIQDLEGKIEGLRSEIAGLEGTRDEVKTEIAALRAKLGG